MDGLRLRLRGTSDGSPARGVREELLGGLPRADGVAPQAAADARFPVETRNKLRSTSHLFHGAQRGKGRLAPFGEKRVSGSRPGAGGEQALLGEGPLTPRSPGGSKGPAP